MLMALSMLALPLSKETATVVPNGFDFPCHAGLQRKVLG